MAASDAEFVELADLAFLTLVRVQLEHPRSEVADDLLRYFANRLELLHRAKGEPVPAPVQQALTWATAEGRDPTQGRRRDYDGR